MLNDQYSQDVPRQFGKFLMHDKDSRSGWIENGQSVVYSATMTGNPFLFRETKLLAELLVNDNSWEEARARIEEQNLFQYRSTKSIPKRVNALGRRLKGAPTEILRFLSNAPISDARLINLLVIAVKDRLYREFLLEEVAPAYAISTTLSSLSVERFFDTKASISPKVASWKQEARTKLRNVWTASLSESGILDREMLLQRPVPAPDTTELIMTYFTKPYRVIAGVDL